MLLNPPGKPKELLDWVKSNRRIFLEKWHETNIYLSDKDNEIFKNMDAQSRRIILYILDNMPDDEDITKEKERKLSPEAIDFDSLKDAYKKAIKCLREKLNPKHLEKFLESQ